MNWRGVLMLGLLAGAIFSGWSVWTHHERKLATAIVSGRSDYVLRNFELISLDKTGKESFTLRAPLLQQTPDAKTMELSTPLFLMPDANGHYWQVRSQSGWVSEKRDEIRLRGRVKATSPVEDSRAIAMNTEQLNVFPNTHLAKSSDIVTVTEPGLTMRGRGMDADLTAKRFTLLSQATARYVPSR
ncbi:MAG: LPS export ABC transporter periplasmic protein LptC [Luteimonas sp.]